MHKLIARPPKTRGHQKASNRRDEAVSRQTSPVATTWTHRASQRETRTAKTKLGSQKSPSSSDAEGERVGSFPAPSRKSTWGALRLQGYGDRRRDGRGAVHEAPATTDGGKRAVSEVFRAGSAIHHPSTHAGLLAPRAPHSGDRQTRKRGSGGQNTPGKPDQSRTS